MRKAIVAILAFAAASFSPVVARAQEAPVSAGFKIGLNLADVPQLAKDFEDMGAPKTMNRNGFMGGGYLAIHLTPLVDFQPEVMYTEKGLRVQEPSGATLTTKLDYIEIPLLFSVGTRDGLYGFAGPSINFNVRARSRDDSLACTNLPCGDLNIKDQIEQNEYGLVIGAGVRESWLLIEGRWIQGLSDIEKDKTLSPNTKYLNRGFGLLFGVRF